MPHMFPSLIAKGISQEFKGTRPVLTGVDLTVHPGQIHAVVGQSGAGKTALADILGGVTKPATGSIHIQGQLTSLKSEQDALAKTIRYVKQGLDRTSRLTVAEALQLEAIPKKFGLVDMKAFHERASGQLSMYGLSDVDPKTRMCELPPGKQKLVQIAATVGKTAALILLDDPSASLAYKEMEALFQRLSQLQYADTGVVYFTSRAEEALQVGDQISVLRDGALIACHDPDSVFAAQLTGEMVGRDLTQIPAMPPRAPWPEVAIRVESLCIDHCVHALSLKVRRGEIVGLVGLYGAGQSEVVRAMGGAVPRTEGEIYLRAASQPSRIKTREDAMGAGVGFIPDPHGALMDGVGREYAYSPSSPIRELNSANPQKPPIAACLKAGCSVLLFDNPTGGLNVACRIEVARAIHDIADQGTSIIAASTNVEELVSFCDRIAIMVDGRIVRSVERSAFSVEKIYGYLKAGK